MKTKYLIIGAGISGLTFANYVDLQFAHNPIDFTYDEESDAYAIVNNL